MADASAYRTGKPIVHAEEQPCRLPTAHMINRVPIGAAARRLTSAWRPPLDERIQAGKYVVGGTQTRISFACKFHLIHAATSAATVR